MKVIFYGCKRLLGYSTVLFAVISFSPFEIRSQVRGPKVVSQPQFNLSPDAAAAGIDGLIGVSLTIDRTGNVKKVVIHGGPAWPCKDSSAPSQIDSVRESVKKQLMATVFEPSVKDGKPKEVDVSLQFAVGEAYRRAASKEQAEKDTASDIKVVDAGIINGRAIRLAKPVDRRMYGIVTVGVTIDEQGNVTNAGAVNGHPFLQESARDAACSSKFSPTILHGKPVKVTGVIVYNFSRN